MAHEIFISLTHGDTQIAEALRDALAELFGDAVKVRFSTSQEIEGGIRHGEDWFEWIVDRVRECDFALVLITPTSVQKPWILWEAGAVHGAALATAKEGLRKVRPLVYQLDNTQIPSPIRESKVQARRGDKKQDIDALFTEIIDQYREELSTDRLSKAFRNLDHTSEGYLQRVESALLNVPLLPTSVVIEEWRLRLDNVLKQQRMSEVEHLHAWMDIAFGRERQDQPQPLDLRIHSRLGELYLSAKKYARAIEQFELARQLAPRDIFVLRVLGKAYLASDRRERAKQVIDRIAELDEQAFVHNAECAALLGRWYREGGNLEDAERVYRDSLDMNADSYYLANVLAEVRLQRHNVEGAHDAFRRALDIIEHLDERNLWTDATAANAAFFVGDDAKAKTYLESIQGLRPTADDLATIEGGLRRLAPHLEGGEQRLAGVLERLRA